MKKILSTVLVLTYAMSLTKLYATTTTAGAAPTSTAGMYQTQTQPQTTAKPAQALQGGTATSTSRPATTPVCVDSGILGTRCGVKAEQFCKNNPDNPDCRKILNENKETK